MTLGRSQKIILGAGLLVGLAALDNWLFGYFFKISYLRWYLENGTWISAVSTLAALSWDEVEEKADLISANPWIFIGACLHYAGLPLFALGTAMRTKGAGTYPGKTFDVLLSIPCILFIALSMFAWLLVVAPVQYVVFLFCGAPGRFLSASGQRAEARYVDGKLEVKATEVCGESKGDWWNASINRKPVALTNLFASLLLLLLDKTGWI